LDFEPPVNPARREPARTGTMLADDTMHDKCSRFDTTHESDNNPQSLEQKKKHTNRILYLFGGFLKSKP
jgi:hypothetical protein